MPEIIYRRMLFYTYLAILFLCFLVSLTSIKQQGQAHLQLFSVFLGITVLTEICATFLIGFFNLENNYIVYNWFILLQFPVLAYYLKMVIASKATKNIINLFILVFPVFWIYSTLYIFGINKWNSYAVLFGDLFIICVGAWHLYELFIRERLIDFKTTPEFWISAALVFYACCELPIVGLINYAYGENGNAFLSGILQILNLIMYISFIYAFLCRRTTHTTKSSPSS